MIKKIIRILLLLSFGIIIGAVVSFFWSFSVYKMAREYSLLSYIAFEEEDMNNHYFSMTKNSDIRIDSLKHLIKFYESLYERDVIEKNIVKNFHSGRATAYARLGLLYEEKGEIKLANNNFNNALRIIQDHQVYEGWIGTEKEINNVIKLKEFILEADKRMMSTVVPSKEGQPSN